MLRADSEAKLHPSPSGYRSYASQLFQGVAISTIYPSYREDLPSRAGDTGERINDPDNIFKSLPFPGLRPEEIQRMNRAIAGDSNRLTIVEHSSMNPSDSNIHVSSEQDLQNQLRQLKEGGRLPAIVFVDSRNEPFWTDSGAGLAGGSGGGHCATVTDYDANACRVTLDNQWGTRTDHQNISARELFIATQSPDNLSHRQQLQDAVDRNRKEGVFAPEMELQLLRSQKDWAEFNDEQYVQGVQRVIVNAERHWQQQSKHGRIVDKDQQDRLLWAYYQMKQQLPEPQQHSLQSAIERQRPGRDL